VVGDSTLHTSMFVTCKHGNLFFPCFYMWLVTVLCRYGKFIFPCLYVWQKLRSEVMKDVETSYYVWELMFPSYSIGIYFSSALCGEGCWNIHCMGTYVS